MARQTCLEESADIAWLFETHLKPFADMHAQTVVAILYGNEDGPDKVECFAVNHYQAAPIATFVQNEEGNLVKAENELVQAARAIVHQRDYFSENQAYDQTTFRPDADQCFDDWAADILSAALEAIEHA